MRIYRKIPKISKNEAILKLQSTDLKSICDVLLGISELEDWKWVQEVCLKYVKHEDRWVAASAISSLGSLTRLSGKLDKSKVLFFLQSVNSNDPLIKGKIEDAISDIEIYISDSKNCLSY